MKLTPLIAIAATGFSRESALTRRLACTNDTSGCGDMPEEPHLIDSPHFIRLNYERMQDYYSDLSDYETCVTRVSRDYDDCLDGPDDSGDGVDALMIVLIATGSVCGCCCLLFCWGLTLESPPKGVKIDDIAIILKSYGPQLPRDYLKLLRDCEVINFSDSTVIGWMFTKNTLIHVDNIVTELEFNQLVTADIFVNIGGPTQFYLSPSTKPLSERLSKYMPADRANTVANQLITNYKIDYNLVFETMRGNGLSQVQSAIDAEVLARLLVLVQRNQAELQAHHTGIPLNNSATVHPVDIADTPQATIRSIHVQQVTVYGQTDDQLGD